MTAVIRKSLADLGRRKVQTAVILLVVFLSSLSATLALTLLVESDAPFDHAFQQAQGAPLTMTFAATAVPESELRARAGNPAVSAFAGPFKVLPWTVQQPDGQRFAEALAGRGGPGGAVDRLTLSAGRWARNNTEVVVSQQMADQVGVQIGDALTSASTSAIPTMTVVGIASGVGNEPSAWTLPGAVPLFTTGKVQTSYLMDFRLVHATTNQDVVSAANSISAGLPQGAVVDTSNYLDAKLGADRTTAVMIPFLLAFSIFALLASALIIANLVSGAVIAGTRDIGIMKSVGFTPAQVVGVLAGQMLLPAMVGCVLGVPVGILASQPFLSDTAHAFGLPRTFGVAPGPDALGVLAILLVVIATTIFASLRAGRMSAASAIATGSSPATGHGYRLARIAARINLPRALTLGGGESFSKPARSAMTVGAILIGVATVTFSLGLSRSLSDVKAGLARDAAVQIQVFRESSGPGSKGPQTAVPSGPGSPPATAPPTDEQTTALIAAQPGTARFVAERMADVSVAGAGEPVPLTAYRGDSSWLGYPIINGRWFSAPGEAVAP